MSAEVGYAELLRTNRSFTRLFGARLVSLFGDWFNLLAVLAMLRAFGAESASSFAIVLILKTLPAVVASPVAGVVADRMSRRTLMIASDLTRAVAVLGLLGLAIYPSVPALYALVMAQAALGAFFDPAREAMLPEIVRPEELTAANALSAASWSAMLSLGAAVGGLTTASFGWEVALAVDLASYLLSAALLVGVVEPPWQPVVRDTPTLLDAMGWTDLREGLGWLGSRPRVLTLALVKLAWQTGNAATLVLALVGERWFPVAGDAMLGVTVLYVARGVGTGLGPIAARALSRSHPAAMERFIAGGFATGAVFYGLLGLAPNVWVAAVLVAAAHLGGSTVWVFSTVRLQQSTPSLVRGRVFAAELAAFTVGHAIASGGAGALSDAGVPIGGLTTLMAALLGVGGVLWLLRGARWGWAEGASDLDANPETGRVEVPVGAETR